MYTFNSLTIYILIGIILTFILEKSNEKLSTENEEDRVKLNYTARFILILAWPVYLILFMIELIKNTKNY